MNLEFLQSTFLGAARKDDDPSAVGAVAVGEEEDDGGGDDGGDDGGGGVDGRSPSGLGFFERYRVSHDLIRGAERYFDLSTLNSGRVEYDPTGGGDALHNLEMVKLERVGGGGTTRAKVTGEDPDPEPRRDPRRRSRGEGEGEGGEGVRRVPYGCATSRSFYT